MYTTCSRLTLNFSLWIRLSVIFCVHDLLCVYYLFSSHLTLTFSPWIRLSVIFCVHDLLCVYYLFSSHLTLNFSPWIRLSVIFCLHDLLCVYYLSSYDVKQQSINAPNIILCVLRLVNETTRWPLPMLSVSLDCPFLMAPSVFSNFYLGPPK